MPIKPIVLQRRLAEVGRIRIGQVVKSKNGKSRPAKLDKLRFTSASRPLIERVAAAYGGEAREWTPANGGPKAFEVITAVDRVPVVVPPGSISQHMELWAGGGCQRRCDGETEMLSGEACVCMAEDAMECRPTTRLSLMLRDIEGVGVWRLESHGWNAAAELPGIVDFLERAGSYLNAWLYLKPVRQISKGKTKDFMVPALEVEGVTPGQLAAGMAAPAAIEGNGHAALEAAPVPDYLAEAEQAETVDAVRAVWVRAQEAGHLMPELKAEFTRIVKRLQVGEEKALPEASASSAGEERAPEDVWFDIVAAAGDGWTTSELEYAYAAMNEGALPGSASAANLSAFLVELKAGRALKPDAGGVS